MWLRALYLFLVVACLQASIWQYNRGEYHTKLQQHYSKINTSMYQEYAPHQLEDLLNIPDEYKKVSVTLEANAPPHFLLENQIYDNKIGYMLLTLYGSEKNSIMISRGWLEKIDQTSNNLYLGKPFPKVKWYGVFRKYYQPINWLFGETHSRAFPKTVSRIIGLFDFRIINKYYTKETAKGIVPGLLIAEKATPATIAKDKYYAPSITQYPMKIPQPYNPNKNYGYMFQWLIFSFFALALLVRTYTHNEK